MERNWQIYLQIMKATRASEVPMATLSHGDFEGMSIDEFVEHCKLLDEEGYVDARLAFGGVAHIRLTAKGHNLLDSIDQQPTVSSRKLGFRSP